MAAIALPIRELERSVADGAERARAETERVVRYSYANRADFSTACKVVGVSVLLKWLFAGLARSQGKLISMYQSCDFTQVSDDQMRQLVRRLREIVDKDRDLSVKAGSLGAEVRVLWDASLRIIAEQADHLESIADSLEIECNPEASLLLAMVADQFAAKEAAVLSA